MDKDTDRFLRAINEEKLKAQQRRGDLIEKKLAWVTGLFAVGALKLPLSVENKYILFLVPAIAVIFDLYVLGENYGIKRMGCFIRHALKGTHEADWEAWLRPRRDKFSRDALRLSSRLILGACALFLFASHSDTMVTAVWALGLLGVIECAHVDASRSLRALDAMKPDDFRQGLQAEQDQEPNKASEAISEPAPDAASSRRR